MTGPEHYKAAEKCLEAALGYHTPEDEASRLVSTAQAHATLALVAATIDTHDAETDRMVLRDDGREWAVIR